MAVMGLMVIKTLYTVKRVTLPPTVVLVPELVVKTLLHRLRQITTAPYSDSKSQDRLDHIPLRRKSRSL